MPYHKITSEMLQELRTICCELIQDENELKMVIEDAGIDISQVDFAGSMEAKWRAVIKKANSLGPETLISLVDELLERYPHHRELRGFWRRIGPVLEPVPPDASSYSFDGYVDPPCRWNGYRLKRIIGRGGMGIVYRARVDASSQEVRTPTPDPEIEPPETPDSLEKISFPAIWVAVKMLKRARVGQGTARQQFMTEMYLLSQVNHPNIVRINRVGMGYTTGDQPYIEMELIEDGSLSQHLKPVAPGESAKTWIVDDALQFIQKIARALYYLHTAHQIYHLDLKPSNILLHRMEPKLADFGLAMPLRREQGEGITSGGGTLGYCAPEQMNGDAVGAHSDIFSLGVLFWEMIAGAWPPKGREPFAGRSGWLQHSDFINHPRYLELLPSCQELLRQMTEEEPGKRPASAQEIVDVCERLRIEWIVEQHHRLFPPPVAPIPAVEPAPAPAPKPEPAPAPAPKPEPFPPPPRPDIPDEEKTDRRTTLYALCFVLGLLGGLALSRAVPEDNTATPERTVQPTASSPDVSTPRPIEVTVIPVVIDTIRPPSDPCAQKPGTILYPFELQAECALYLRTQNKAEFLKIGTGIFSECLAKGTYQMKVVCTTGFSANLSQELTVGDTTPDHAWKF